MNKQRVLVFGCRGLAHRDRHLMEDMKSLMPHSKGDSKMQRKRESLFAVNEIAEMKNCNKCVLFEPRGKRDLFMWISNVPRGPSIKFQVENVHTMAELKLTGNCLKGSRPLLSFDKSFGGGKKGSSGSKGGQGHMVLMRELLTQVFGVPNMHPKSQPFFDRVYTFSAEPDGRRIWFRHYQIVEEDGSLVEIGPRFVLNPIKIFDSSFSGSTLWENPDYVSPGAHRAAFKRMKAGKYVQHVQSKAAREASKPKGPTYPVDPLDEVFKDLPTEPDQDEDQDGDESVASKSEGKVLTKANRVKKNKKKKVST